VLFPHLCQRYIFPMDSENQLSILHAVVHGFTYTLSIVSILTLLFLCCMVLCVVNMLLFESVFGLLAGRWRSVLGAVY
jgi:hypothetical protein